MPNLRTNILGHPDTLLIVRRRTRQPELSRRQIGHRCPEMRISTIVRIDPETSQPQGEPSRALVRSGSALLSTVRENNFISQMADENA
ncbi:hypothetical protein X777_06215 [Ooceraea biroi]|uniref:Uncharacterized protein n=1 Tax=Ooceraea biroi TaxID=2015173 RepID=A0A026WAN1_OOCBI|nr:hypothetical protein X777_06215 [Ooceraea biroi]